MKTKNREKSDALKRSTKTKKQFVFTAAVSVIISIHFRYASLSISCQLLFSIGHYLYYALCFFLLLYLPLSLYVFYRPFSPVQCNFLCAFIGRPLFHKTRDSSTCSLSKHVCTLYTMYRMSIEVNSIKCGSLQLQSN